MTDTNINLIIKYLANEDLQVDEYKFIKHLRDTQSKEFDEIEAIYKADIFTRIPFDTTEAFKKVKASISADSKQIKMQYFYQQAWFKVAASILILFSVSILVLTQYKWEVSLNNLTAKVQKYNLPDGSEIILDKQSSVCYSRTVFVPFDRKLSLKGRAYFHIIRNSKKQFVVSTNQIKIIDLGTEFTVNQQGKNTQIVLNEGVIRLEGKLFVESKILNTPGAQVLLNDKSILKDNIVSPELYASWTEQIIRFNNCTVKDVFNFLEDSYGIDVAVSDSSYLDNTLYGSAPSDNPYLISKAIEKILNIQIEINDKN
jgi:ferric-dicitrate binding protein FerR (iron transport regulator)